MHEPSLEGVSPPRLDAAALGIPHPRRIFAQLSPAALVEWAVRRGEGLLSDRGALAVHTGRRTGRSPNDKFVVRDSLTESTVDWTANAAISPQVFDHLRLRLQHHFADRDLFVFDGYVGADPGYRLAVRVVCEKAWHCLFAQCLFIRPPYQELNDFQPDWTIWHAADYQAQPETDNTRSDAFIILNFTDRHILIGGTHYAGEVKKAMFTVMNHLLPDRGVFPMHCAANVGDGGDVALFFGLSGTGKTTLSADARRRLIGDDEHGWSDSGIFNFEGGCYAKTIRLSPTEEPHIWNAVRFGCVLENVPLDPNTRRPDFDDPSITENTRAAYPLDHISHIEPGGCGGHPCSIVFLTCDAFGVLPPWAKLTPQQAVDYFLCGYTAKVAGTETGLTEPLPVFSTCFARPFLPRPPRVYAAMLEHKLQRHAVPVWLLNTGWIGGPYGVGRRIPLDWTRQLLQAIVSGAAEQIPCQTEPYFGLSVPQACPGVPPELFRPRQNWPDPDQYDQYAKDLAERFRQELQKYR